MSTRTIRDQWYFWRSHLRMKGLMKKQKRGVEKVRTDRKNGETR